MMSLMGMRSSSLRFGMVFPLITVGVALAQQPPHPNFRPPVGHPQPNFAPHPQPRPGQGYGPGNGVMNPAHPNVAPHPQPRPGQGYGPGNGVMNPTHPNVAPHLQPRPGQGQGHTVMKPVYPNVAPNSQPHTPHQTTQNGNKLGTNTSGIAGMPNVGKGKGKINVQSGKVYQMPPAHVGSKPGSTLVYFGLNYIVNNNGTMSPYTVVDQEAQAYGGQAYQVPAGYKGYAEGSLINYGGADYQIGSDGTMTATSGSTDDSSQTDTSEPDAQKYQIPAGFEGSAVGSVINYGGANYVINDDGTMSASAPAQSNDDASQAENTPSTPVQRYQIPPGYAGYPAGTVISYGGATYQIGSDGTMSPYTGPMAR